MNTIVVIASGASLTDDQTACVYNSGKVDTVVAVSNVALTKVPWADAMAAVDSAWWIAHPEFLHFRGQRFSAKGYTGTKHLNLKELGIYETINSGLFGMFVAREYYNAERIILLGFDMHRRNGQHFFGAHTRKVGDRTLTNSTESIFEKHIKQFQLFDTSKCEVINSTPNSDLKRFPYVSLCDIV